MTSLSKTDVRRALTRLHFAQASDIASVFDRLENIQFDPIAPVGCNHDLVLQSRLPGYQIGDWQSAAYQDRLIYDGWDKQASLIAMKHWPVRRFFYDHFQPTYDRMVAEYGAAVERVLGELRDRGPLRPKDLIFQERRADWEGSWYGPNVGKVILRALWNTGRVMTVDRVNGHHVYDLAERVIPDAVRLAPSLSPEEMKRELVLARHTTMGMVRPTAPYEVWSYQYYAGPRRAILEELVHDGRLIPVKVDRMEAHVTRPLLDALEADPLEPAVRFVAPLDPLMWDRGMIKHLFDFDYVWEIYVPEPKRRWGYYVLPVMDGDTFVGRVEFQARKGGMEMLRWHFEPVTLKEGFWERLDAALRRFTSYAGVQEITADPSVDRRVRSVVSAVSKAIRPSRRRVTKSASGA